MSRKPFSRNKLDGLLEIDKRLGHIARQALERREQMQLILGDKAYD